MPLRYTIQKAYTFEAAHRLLGMSPGHQCARIHGHSYKVVVAVSSLHLDERGMVEDFSELDVRVKPLVADLDHRLLLGPMDPLSQTNDKDLRVLSHNPTAENIAKLFWEALVDMAGMTFDVGDLRLESVTVFETEKCSAQVKRDS